MAAVADIMSGIAAQLSTVSGLRVTDYVPDSFNPPAAFVNLTEIAEGTFGMQSVDISLDAVVLVARGVAPRIGQHSLYDLYRLVFDAIAATPDLGLGDGTDARVVRYRATSVEEIAAMQCYGGAFEIEVTTPG